ncbi:MAG: ROK family protein [Kineosporiaceae bacterium]
MTPRAGTLGLDVGGTKIAGAVVDPSGRVLQRRRTPTGPQGRRDHGFAVSLPFAAAMLADARAAGIDVDGIGVGVPEYVRPDGVVTSAEVMDWTGQPAPAFADLAPVTVDSDVRCGGRAEALLGAGRGRRRWVYVSAGTGLSSVLMTPDGPWQGARGEAIALGELPVAREAGPQEAGSLEAFASGDGIRRRYIAGGHPAAGAQAVLSAAAAGDPDAVDVVASAARALAHALHWVVALVDPECVVLGGGLGTSRGPWAAALDARFAALTAGRPGGPPLLRAELGSDAGAIGAALAHRGRVG